MKSKSNPFTDHQLGALISMAIVAVWGVWVIWLHLTRPMGMDFIELLFLSALVPIYMILLPFYGLRVRWSYISGIIVLLGLFVGLLKSILDNSLFFSLSAYNMTTVIVLFIALVCIYFSVRAYLELKPVGWLKNALGIGGSIGISVLAVWWVSTNEMNITGYQLKQVIQGVQARTSDIEHMDDKIEALMAEGDIPSLAAAIVVNDQIVWLKGFGEQSDPETIFDIGSIAKPFTATAIMQLYEKGQIKLDDDINQYLPFKVRHPDYPEIPITIRMLLTHRSCLAHNTELYYGYSMGSPLRQWGMEKRGWEVPGELDTLTYAEFITAYLEPGGSYFTPNNWAPCKPGTDFVYSTPGFDLLAYLVEQVTHQSFDDYIQANIFAPLEMSGATASPLSTIKHMAIPFERWYGVLAKTNVQLPLSQRRRVGGGGIYSSAVDLANFLIAHMNQGEFDGHRLLQPDSAAAMHNITSHNGGDFMQTGYGYGWARFQSEPRQMWDITFQPRGFQGHGGRYWGYGSAMYMVEEGDDAYGYVLLINTSMVESLEEAWFFSIQANLQDLLLGEAHRLYKSSNDG